MLPNEDDMKWKLLSYYEWEVRRRFTFTCWYRNVNTAAGGRNPMMAHARMRMLVRMGQLSSATHGEASSQLSHPSAQGRHSKAFKSSNEEASLWGRDEIIENKQNKSQKIKLNKPRTTVANAADVGMEFKITFSGFSFLELLKLIKITILDLRLASSLPEVRVIELSSN